MRKPLTLFLSIFILKQTLISNLMRERMQILMIILAIFFLCGNAQAAEYWLDNTLIENPPKEKQTGAKDAPFVSVANLQASAVKAGDTINIKGTNVTYRGGFQGYSLAWWRFGECIIKHDESKGKVIFYNGMRTIHKEAWKEVGGNLEVVLHPKATLGNYWLVREDTKVELVKQVSVSALAQGYRHDKVNAKLKLNIGVVKDSMPDVTIRGRQ